MMHAGVTSLFLILGIFCSATWARSWIPMKRTSSSPLRCVRTVHEQCIEPVFQQYEGMNPEAFIEKIRTTDLRETCAPIMQAQECARGVLGSPVCDVDMHELREASYEIHGIMIDYICRDNIEVFRQYGGCLLTLDQQGVSVIVRAINQQCGVDSILPRPGQCPSSSAFDCEEWVVASQCGAEIARHLRALGERTWAVLGCSAGSKMMKKEHRERFNPVAILQKDYSMMKKDQYEQYNPFKINN